MMQTACQSIERLLVDCLLTLRLKKNAWEAAVGVEVSMIEKADEEEVVWKMIQLIPL